MAHIIMNGKLIYLLPFLPLVFCWKFTEFFIFPKSILLCFIICIYLLNNIIKKDLKIHNNVIFFIYIFYLGTISFNSKLQFNSLYNSLYFLTFYLFFTHKKKIKILRYIKYLNITGFIICIYAALQYIGIDFIWDFTNADEWIGINKVFSTLGNKNFLSEILVLLILLNDSVKRFTKNNIFYIIVVLLVLEKTAVFFLICYFIYKYKTKLLYFSKLKKTILSIFIIVITLLLFNTGKYELHNKITGKNSFCQRLYIWKTTVDIVKEYFFIGVGPGNFKDSFYYYQTQNLFDFKFNYFSEPEFAHNEILQIFSETGFIGIILIVLLLNKIIKKGLLTKRFRFIFIYLIFQSMFSFPLRLPSALIILFPVIRSIVLRIKEDNSHYYISKNKIISYCLFLSIFIFLTLNISFITSNFISKKGFLEKNEKLLFLGEKLNIVSSIPIMNIALYFYEQENFLLSQFYFEKAWNYTKNPLIYYYKGMIRLASGNNNEAKDLLEGFVIYYPFNKEGYYNLSLIYRYEGNEKKAEENFDKFQVLLSLEK
ncbi:MAG: O-antigen ligase family protein [Candidatus Muirbacterium halophilum]|nr:O-antigen ligase family protein [Candidatus Muirbacterium halophilum]MCK9476980.1 O-antigen ligase family protein [Candidatus Muirbacterium halophilum]